MYQQVIAGQKSGKKEGTKESTPRLDSDRLLRLLGGHGSEGQQAHAHAHAYSAEITTLKGPNMRDAAGVPRDTLQGYPGVPHIRIPKCAICQVESCSYAYTHATEGTLSR